MISELTAGGGFTGEKVMEIHKKFDTNFLAPDPGRLQDDRNMEASASWSIMRRTTSQSELRKPAEAPSELKTGSDYIVCGGGASGCVWRRGFGRLTTQVRWLKLVARTRRSQPRIRTVGP